MISKHLRTAGRTGIENRHTQTATATPMQYPCWFPPPQAAGPTGPATLFREGSGRSNSPATSPRKIQILTSTAQAPGVPLRQAHKVACDSKSALGGEFEDARSWVYGRTSEQIAFLLGSRSAWFCTMLSLPQVPVTTDIRVLGYYLIIVEMRCLPLSVMQAHHALRSADFI
jgi:hypothetical protein